MVNLGRVPVLQSVFCASKLLCWAVGGTVLKPTAYGAGAIMIATSVRSPSPLPSDLLLALP